MPPLPPSAGKAEVWPRTRTCQTCVCPRPGAVVHAMRKWLSTLQLDVATTPVTSSSGPYVTASR
jgi:hypothetical protein